MSPSQTSSPTHHTKSVVTWSRSRAQEHRAHIWAELVLWCHWSLWSPLCELWAPLACSGRLNWVSPECVGIIVLYYFISNSSNTGYFRHWSVIRHCDIVTFFVIIVLDYHCQQYGTGLQWYLLRRILWNISQNFLSQTRFGSTGFIDGNMIIIWKDINFNFQLTV